MMLLSHDLAGTNTPDDLSRWFRSGPNTRYAGLVYVYGTQPSREDALAWLQHTPDCQQWNALFVLRYREKGSERWLIVGERKPQNIEEQQEECNEESTHRAAL